VLLFEVYVVPIPVVYVWQVQSEITHDAHVDAKSQHRELEEEHDTVRAFPELPEKIGLVNDKCSNRDPTYSMIN
jgi:hypothetical protein